MENEDILNNMDFAERNKSVSVSKEKIAEYWIKNHPSDLSEIYLNFDWADALCVCWNCAKETKYTQRCHIIPKMLGGSNSDPSNFVLLCDQCHREAPNVNDKNAMWNWIKSNKLPFSVYGVVYRGQKAMIEFKKKHNISIMKVIWEILDGNISTERVNEYLMKYNNKTGLHGITTTTSTHLSVFEMMLNEYNEKIKINPCKIPFPLPIKK